MKNPFWIRSAGYDWWWFIAPMALPPVIVLFLPEYLTENQTSGIHPWSWLLIILSIDVAHVYSTVYKTYFHPVARRQHRMKLWVVPIIVWITGVLVYSVSDRFFWSCIAYFAVFHFIRQQYGFFRLYSVKASPDKLTKSILNTTIYAVTVIPVLIWHCKGQRNFNWMTEGDFLYFNLPEFIPVFQILLLSVLILYLLAEYREKGRNERWNLPRILLTSGTGLSYYVGIVATDNDFIFTLLNVLGHGIPYMALVWYSEKRRQDTFGNGLLRYVFTRWGWILFYVIVLLFAYFEESLWDLFIWRENQTGFGWLYPYTSVIRDSHVLAFLVPLLVVPQLVHYVLDGYIWKKRDTQILRVSSPAE